MILDTHTNSQWTLAPSPGKIGRRSGRPTAEISCFSAIAARTMSLWRTPVSQGRAAGDAQLIQRRYRTDVAAGFTAAGALHYQLSAGYAEV
jgi:hypothetical protein